MHQTPASLEELARAVRTIPDFPKPGIQFKDITPILGDPWLFRSCVDQLTGGHLPGSVEAVAGIDARGFIFGAALALRLGAAFVPIRKQGKLPYQTFEQSYELEYGTNTVAIHTDALRAGQRVVLVDDLLATGGTAGAAVTLLRKCGATILEAVFTIELDFLNGRQQLSGTPVRSLIHVPG